MIEGKSKHGRRPGNASRDTWEAAATAEAIAMGIEPLAVLSRAKFRHLVVARSRAWTKLYATGRYSLTGLGKVSGYDHTTILNSIKQHDNLCRWFVLNPVIPFHLRPVRIRAIEPPPPKPRPQFNTIPILVPAESIRRRA